MNYASKTTVNPEKSQAEIKKLKDDLDENIERTKEAEMSARIWMEEIKKLNLKIEEELYSLEEAREKYTAGFDDEIYIHIRARIGMLMDIKTWLKELNNG